MPNPTTLRLAVAFAALSIAATTASAGSPAVKTQPAPQKTVAQTQLSSEFVYKYLVGEIAGQRGDLGLASNIFLELAKTSKDPRLAERAAKAAVYGNKPKTAVQATALWAELDPASIEAQQATTQILVSSGRLQEAKPHLQKLLAKEDTRANGFLYLNSLFANQPDKNAVLALVQELAKPYPDLPEAHFTIAHSAWAAGNDDLATSELTIADKLRPGWETSAILQGQVLYRQSPDIAIGFYRNFLNRHPNASEVRLTYARLLVNEKQFAPAKTEFIKLVEASNNNPEVLVVVGLLSLQSMDLADAEKYFLQAEKAGFKDPDQLYLYLGQIAEKQKKDDKALTIYNKVQPGNHYLDAKLNIAALTARTKGADAGLAMLAELKELNSEQQTVVAQAQANLLTQAKRYNEAYDVLDNAVNTMPNTPEIIYDYAMAAERVQKLDVMERELRKLINLKPDFAQAYNALGYTLADRNLKLEEARGLIEKALALSPNDHYILDSMGWVHYRLGKLDTAADYLRRAYTAQTDPEIAAHLGEVLWKQGKYSEALQTWEEALKVHPENEVLINTTKKFKQ
jgi:tetratricopeptide (TPR) repeat protein